MTANKKGSKTGPETNNGKKKDPAAPGANELTAKCDFEEKSDNGHLYCKKSKAGSYCVKDKDAKGSAFKCPIETKKYTIKRSNEDIERVEELRRLLRAKGDHYHIFNNDSDIYRNLPEIHVEAIRKIDKLEQMIEEQQAKIRELDRIPTIFIELLTAIDKSLPDKVLDKTSKLIKFCNEKQEIKTCTNFDQEDKECELSDIKCAGKNTKCEDYEEGC